LNGNNYGKRSDSQRRAREVLRIAEEEGYQPNSAAQALVGRSTRNLCLLISSHIQSGWSNAYFSQVLGGVERACHEHDYGLVLNSYKNDGFDAFFARRKLGGRSFDGIVFAGYVTTEMSRKLRRHKVPFISINKHFANPDQIPAYYSDGSEFEIALYAHRHGHRRIGFVDEGIYPDFQQINDQISAAGLSDCRVVPLPIKTPGDYHCGAAVMEQFAQLDLSQRPTLVAANYQTCAALLKEFKMRQMSCPEDLSLVSRCDSEVCQMCDPELTVIAPDTETIGQVATERLITFLENKTPLTYERCQTQINVVERQSVKSIHQGEN
jgi:DNA-binding LacI/PurR family transcriptional regulator